MTAQPPPPKPTPHPTPKPPSRPPRRRRWPRVLAWLLGGLLAALLLALAGAWVWAGSEGSLAAALRWAARSQPIAAEQVSGSLRHGGAAARLTWQQDGLRLQATQVQLRWTPAALLRGAVQIDSLSAGQIEIAESSPPSAAPSPGGPPASLALPLKLQIRELAVGELRWAGPPAYSVQDLSGQLEHDGDRILLTITRARFAGGLYRARAALAAHAPVSVELALSGALTVNAPGGSAVPLAVQATLQGPLADMRAQAELRPGPTGQAALEPPALPQNLPAPDAAPPTARASARVTPWAAQPLPEARVDVASLDLRALWPQAPLASLTGRLDLAPLPPGGPAGWAIKAAIANAAPGPWNEGRLPLQDARADLTWADGIATLRALGANVGGGALQAEGRWADGGGWRIDARIHGIDPARLHARLAAWPLDGAVQLGGAGEAVDFNAALQAQAPAGHDARANNALGLRDVQATGRWAAGGLTLQKLRLRMSDAELSGQASLRTEPPGVNADLTLAAPGLALALKGQAQPASGEGDLQVRITDAARLRVWASKLPGANRALAGMPARGQATLQAGWRGGWRNPALQARLNAPRLAWRAPGGSGGGEAPIEARQIDLRLSGTPAQAHIEASGQIAQGQRQIDLRLSASGARASPADAPLAQARWSASLQALHARVQEPALGQGAWQLALSAALPLAWSPQGGGQFDAGAGQLTLAAPSPSPTPAAQAAIAWEPVRWQAGELTSAGRVTGLPLAWLERLSGASLAQAGIGGDVMLEGGWNIATGRPLRVAAHLARASGDLALLAHDAETGLQTRVAAGLRQASLSLASDGHALTLRLIWESERAGSAEGSLRTELRARSGDMGNMGSTHWSWPPEAPLQGRLRARLPQMAAWSALAPPGWRLRGSARADVDIGGNRANPRLSGTLAADDLALRSVADGVQLTGGRLRARLDGARLLLDELTLRGAAGAGQGGGALHASGQAGWTGSRMQASLAITLDQLRASLRADRQITLSGQLQTALDGRQLQADGRLRVERARIQLPDENAPALDSDVTVLGAAGNAPAGSPAQSPLAVAARVQIDLGDDFRLRGMGIDTQLAGVLALAANGPASAMPQLTGTVRVLGGSARAYSQQLNIARGSLVFTGDAANPALDIVALRPIHGSDQQVGAQVMGSALLPRVRLYSQPALPDNEALAWLLLGRAAPSSGAESAMLQSAALALLGGRQGRPLAAHFGLDELHFSSPGPGANSAADASVTLGKRLSERLYAAYERSLSGAGGTLMIFHELSRRWTLRGQTGENSALDLIFKLAFD